eukprot:scaffold17077_cov174-Skeletonema_marinoi.AAC.3
MASSRRLATRTRIQVSHSRSRSGLVLVLVASLLSRVKDASILSWPTIMGHQKLLIVIFTA